MSPLKNRRCVLTEQTLMISLLINFVVCISTDNFDYEDYYDDDLEYSEQAIKYHEVKLGDTVLLTCPNGSIIWRSENETLRETIEKIIDEFDNLTDRKNVTVRSEEDAGFYDCWQLIGMYPYPDQRHRIIISPETTSIEPKNTRAMGVDSKYRLVSLLPSTSGDSNESVFLTPTNWKSMVSSSVTAKYFNWHTLCPVIICLL